MMTAERIHQIIAWSEANPPETQSFVLVGAERSPTGATIRAVATKDDARAMIAELLQDNGHHRAVSRYAVAATVAAIHNEPLGDNPMKTQYNLIREALIEARKDGVEQGFKDSEPITKRAVEITREWAEAKMLAVFRKIKAWRDSPGNENFPHDVREEIEEALAANPPETPARIREPVISQPAGTDEALPL